ncbi:hypothetical protein ACIBG8_25175 [Nonomuraea sp. NPDC050556]|uniref:hypothetical protein n=1 Tax=Nonomuraea sp. NPDC050556 TaxID=3364369 RepID=UPI00378A04B9
MTPDGQVWRAGLAFTALVVSAFLIYQIFSSGFGRVATTRVTIAPLPPPVSAAFTPTIAVVADNFWLTYLPTGLARSGGGAGWARFSSAEGFVEAKVEHGAIAAGWDTYRQHVTLLDARNTTVRGKPATVGRDPSGGLAIVWLERVGTGAWIRVSESLRKELLPVAASVRSPVGD